MTTTDLNSKIDRARGTLVAMAAGDALGAGYEYQPRVAPDAAVGMIGGGLGNFEPGEWTDDTSMAITILEAALAGDLRDAQQLDRISQGWHTWAEQASDVGIQTRHVLRNGAAAGGGVPTAITLSTAAEEVHRVKGQSGGNGSLMRTAPVALAYLRDVAGMVEAATTISGLTHHDPEAGEACVLWCEAIRHGVLTGELDVRAGIRLLPQDRQSTWIERIEVAEASRPGDFTRNGWVVEAFQAAWSAIATTAGPDHLAAGLDSAVRGGGDTDTVAAIAGALLGAAYGESSVPVEWREILHGWPRWSGTQLSDAAATMGESSMARRYEL